MNLLITALFITTMSATDSLVDGKAELVAGDFVFTEGPVWVPGDGLYFTDGDSTIYKAPKEVFRKPSNRANGLAIDSQGRLVACEGGAYRVTRTEKDGTIAVLADKFEGKRFNMTNDLVVRSDGTVFFTDPGPWGNQDKNELDFIGFFARTPDGKVKKLGEGFKFPNGIGLSPDEKTLYLSDTRTNAIYAWDVAADGSVSDKRDFAPIPTPDGMVVSKDGKIWCTSGLGVVVFSPEGTQLEVIKFPQVPANCTLGGDDGKWLYATCRTELYRVRLK
jgi:gluconolactonase